ncbi:RpoE-regulated lipoprotein [Providencia vermicola]|uniref:RpoE-regulated lipoprotein n=1 Tax=Providencia TaxID=586 RepID=UPI0022B6AE5B|nr:MULTISPECIES: RpoE-regulated lipoprotein [Providencia]ELR5119434.1 RpoE-regulated lipoprotein [Providencia stuartii]ELR5141170.1 RpoE-regulated lipoprotein [Providencia stuartii]WBA58524.1 RpoE-regulated lipoprotein [Providencia sp. 21OH12SH02B-Prov]WER23672.1 RpoE-regulated lipoprotein [Providencia stuartii]WER27793.1 RpoE-regulated lipoprotein [Providencia stuartii]
MPKSVIVKLSQIAILSGTFILSGCAGSGGFWSSLSPMNWFSSPITAKAAGVGGITGFTPMQADITKERLDDRYVIRSGMQTEQGEIVTVFQGLDDDKVKIEVFGPEKGYVSRISVSDPDIVTEWGIKIGSPFSDIYEKAFGACKIAEPIDDQPTVECVAPQTAHIVYSFTGKWQGPEGLMPPDDELKNWTVSRIIWKK